MKPWNIARGLCPLHPRSLSVGDAEIGSAGAVLERFQEKDESGRVRIITRVQALPCCGSAGHIDSGQASPVLRYV